MITAEELAQYANGAVNCDKVPFSHRIRRKRFICACRKFMFSFFRRNWTLSDYPIAFVRQSELKEPSTTSERWSVKPWRAEIIGWHGPNGIGDTPQEAYSQLKEGFEKALESRDHPPRPGWRVPLNIQFADTTKVDQYADLADYFIHEVLGYESAWISDESSLWDFTTDDSIAPFFEKIREHFGVDVSSVKSGNLADILEIIALAKQGSPS